MKNEGPSLSHLMLRLRNASPDIFDPRVNAGAAVCDFLRDKDQILVEEKTKAWPIWQNNGLVSRFILLAIWIYLDEAFDQIKWNQNIILLHDNFNEIANYVKPKEVLEDALRGEEFIRRCLNIIDLRPAGETQSQAEDRYKTLDSVEVQRLEKEAIEVRRRAQEVMKQMKKAAAAAAAAKVSRE